MRSMQTNNWKDSRVSNTKCSCSHREGWYFHKINGTGGRKKKCQYFGNNIYIEDFVSEQAFYLSNDLLKHLISNTLFHFPSI